MSGGPLTLRALVNGPVWLKDKAFFFVNIEKRPITQRPGIRYSATALERDR